MIESWRRIASLLVLLMKFMTYLITITSRTRARLSTLCLNNSSCRQKQKVWMKLWHKLLWYLKSYSFVLNHTFKYTQNKLLNYYLHFSCKLLLTHKNYLWYCKIFCNITCRKFHCYLEFYKKQKSAGLHKSNGHRLS